MYTHIAVNVNLSLLEVQEINEMKNEMNIYPLLTRHEYTMEYRGTWPVESPQNQYPVSPRFVEMV